MIIKRKHVCDKTDTPTNDWDIEIERERHETIEENGNLVIDDRKKYCLILKNKELWQTGV